MQLVLASTSRYRRALLEQIDLAVTVAAPPFDERAAERALGPCTPDALALHLARGKAESLAGAFPDALLIGADQVIALDGATLGKPGTADAAVAQLERLAGRTHQSFTAVAVHQPTSGRTEALLDVHALTMRALGRDALASYVARDAPLDCAGAYRIESLGLALFESIAGEDYTGVMGLPLTKLVALLARFGVDPLVPA